MRKCLEPQSLFHKYPRRRHNSFLPAARIFRKRRRARIAKPARSRYPCDMPRFALKIEYNGAPFFGWQRQTVLPSVQGALETAMRALQPDF